MKPEILKLAEECFPSFHPLAPMLVTDSDKLSRFTDAVLELAADVAESRMSLESAEMNAVREECAQAIRALKAEEGV